MDAYAFASMPTKPTTASGEPYIIHPLEAAQIPMIWVWMWILLLRLTHDVVEDTGVSAMSCWYYLGLSAGLVDGVTN